MKRFLSVLFALLLFASPALAAFERILTTRPNIDKVARPSSARLLECDIPLIQTFYLDGGLAWATFTWTGQDEPVLFIWGPTDNEELSGIVIRMDGKWYKVSPSSLLENFPTPCDLPK